MTSNAPAPPTVISWVSCHDPAHDIHRRTLWAGATRQIVITRLPACFSTYCTCSFELPPNTRIHRVPPGVSGLDLARGLGGVLFTITMQ
jgi:hypothetical protein